MASQYVSDVFRVMLKVWFAVLFAAFLSSGISGAALAGSGSYTVQAMDEDVAKTRALSKIPQGKKATDMSCRSQEVGGETAYTCTVKWD